RFRKRDHGGFGSRVGDHARITLLPGDRSDVYDSPVFPASHVRNDSAAAIKHARQIYGDRALPILVCLLPQRRGSAGYPCVVYQYVDLAHASNYFLNRLYDGVGGGYV